MARRRWWALWSLLVLPVLLAGCTGAAPTPTAPITVIPPGERTAAPMLKGELLDGSGEFDLAQHAGDVVVVNFWGSWCAPCHAEADDLEETYQATKDSGVTFIGVNIRDDRAAARRFAEQRNSYPSIYDQSSRVALGFAVTPAGTPTTVIIDRQGRVAVVKMAAVLRGDLEPVVTHLAAERA